MSDHGYDDVLRECICGGDWIDGHGCQYTGPERQILTDLIAELRGMAEHSDHLTEWIGPSLNRAEQRLRELDTPPNSANEHTNLGGAG